MSPKAPRRCLLISLGAVALSGFHFRIDLNDFSGIPMFTTECRSAKNNSAANVPLMLLEFQRSDFELARRESLGFFNDVPSAFWNLMKKKTKEMSPNFIKESIHSGKEWPGLFYQNHYEPDFVCPHERRIGQLGDGGKWVCDPHRISAQEECLVYSIGSNNDFSFEMAVLKDIGPHCEIHTFDFGDYAAGARDVGFRLHSGENKTAVNYHKTGLGKDQPPKFKSLQTIVTELGHENRTIDIFKIDCEGCEWESGESWFKTNVKLRQILVELHKAPASAPKFFDMIYDNDYVIFHKEANIAWSGPQDLCIEYAFLKLAPEFLSLRTDATDVSPSKSQVANTNPDVDDFRQKPTLDFDKILLRTYGEDWKLVNLTDPTFNNALGFTCDFVPFVSTSGQEAEMCVHPFRDIVSDAIRRNKRWEDCDALPSRWNAKEKFASSEPSDEIYVEIGGNIGSCVMEMLLSTNANILVFEPHPRNLFLLQQSILRLGANYQNRVALVPTALGGRNTKSQMFSAKGNMGNSVVGQAIGDNDSQQFEKPIDIHVERIDSILKATVPIPLMKLDVQGFECEILDGLSQQVAGNIQLIKFEMANKWLEQQNCFDLLPRLRKFNFSIISDKGGIITADHHQCGVCDLFAVKGSVA